MLMQTVATFMNPLRLSEVSMSLMIYMKLP